MSENNSKVISVRLPVPLYKKLKTEVKQDSHLSIGELVRTLLRERLINNDSS